eukprot:TRINITY_DN3382_c0_g1_i2.p1 TRINITY_DN3382_c0_g1~~TRINITY_DN3382_c0_g1_i2.p1  ORF type:complete len:465 (-),score=130.26 TRINITY_DN3382_c0_g1_i2:89-1483(-)
MSGGAMRIGAGGVVRAPVEKARSTNDDNDGDALLGKRKLVSVSTVVRKVGEDFSSSAPMASSSSSGSSSMKIKSRGKKRTRQPVSIASLADLASESFVTTAVADEDEALDHHGSRSNKVQQNSMKDIEEMQERQANYAKAVEKSALRTQKLKNEHFGERGGAGVDFFGEEEEDREFRLQLQRSKRLKQMTQDEMQVDPNVGDGGEEVDEGDRVVSAIRSVKQMQKELESSKKSDDRVVFSSAIQFAGVLDSAGDPQGVKDEEIAVKIEESPVAIPTRSLEDVATPTVKHEETEDTAMGNVDEKEEKEGGEGFEENALGLAEPVIDRGLGKVLQLIRSRGLINQPFRLGRRNDERNKVNWDDNNSSIHLRHTDEDGNEMTEKEAFRYLSQKFHGQKLGITKREKRQKIIDKDLKARKSSSSVNALEKLQKVGEKTGQAYVVVDTKALATGVGVVAQKKFSGNSQD